MNDSLFAIAFAGACLKRCLRVQGLQEASWDDIRQALSSRDSSVDRTYDGADFPQIDRAFNRLLPYRQQGTARAVSFQLYVLGQPLLKMHGSKGQTRRWFEFGCQLMQEEGDALGYAEALVQIALTYEGQELLDRLQEGLEVIENSRISPDRVTVRDQIRKGLLISLGQAECAAGLTQQGLERLSNAAQLSLTVEDRYLIAACWDSHGDATLCPVKRVSGPEVLRAGGYAKADHLMHAGLGMYSEDPRVAIDLLRWSKRSMPVHVREGRAKVSYWLGHALLAVSTSLEEVLREWEESRELFEQIGWMDHAQTITVLLERFKLANMVALGCEHALQMIEESLQNALKNCDVFEQANCYFCGAIALKLVNEGDGAIQVALVRARRLYAQVGRVLEKQAIPIYFASAASDAYDSLGLARLDPLEVFRESSNEGPPRFS